jgi:hypothetical protein
MEEPRLRAIFKDVDIPIAEEPFYYGHGLRFASERIRKYVRTGDIVDLGAYHGESAMGLSRYTREGVYSYELVRES